MYHIVYITTNLVNLKIYVGVHSTYNLNDGYLGKGTAIKKSILKYGRQNFKRQILHFCLTRNDAFTIEEQIVDTLFVLRPNTYNLTVGGERSIDVTKHPNREKFRHIYSENARKGYASMPEEVKTLVNERRKNTCKQPHIKQKHKTNTKTGMANMSLHDKEQMKQNMKGNNNNKKTWLLSNIFGFEYIITDLKTYCKEQGLDYHYMFYTLRRKTKKPKCWNLVQLDTTNIELNIS